jgi:hypothetical protein
MCTNNHFRRFGAVCVWLCILGAGLGGVALMADSLSDLAAKLPQTLGPWHKSPAPDFYTPESLSSYIDGGAELYISYNFKRSLALKYLHDTLGEITIDIFDMGHAHDAFGVFAHSREQSDTAVGQGSEYSSGLLTFWQDRYYISILAYPETAEKREAVFNLGRALAAAIGVRGGLPPILSLLPTDGLVPDSTHFFHHYIWLNSFCFVSNDNVLLIAADTPAALGKYRQGGVTYYLLLVEYPSAARAEAAQTRFEQTYLAGAQQGLRHDAGGSWSGCRKLGSRLAVALKAPSADAIRELFAKIK